MFSTQLNIENSVERVMSKKATLFINEHLMKHCWKNLTELTEILWDPIKNLEIPNSRIKGQLWLLQFLNHTINLKNTIEETM